MKTFLWTSLFWIVAAIAALLCLGFGNLWTQVLDNWWIAKIMPKNIQTASCDPVVASAFENMDWCAAAETYNCYPVESEADDLWNTARLQEPLSSVIANQEIIYNYLQDSFAKINQSIVDLQNNYAAQEVEESVVDEQESQRLQLQAQIAALQEELNNL